MAKVVKKSVKSMTSFVGGMVATWLHMAENCPPHVWMAMRPPM